MSSSSTNVVGVHYKVGRKLGEGSFGIIYEGKCFFLVYYSE
jgi:casein kinase 1